MATKAKAKKKATKSTKKAAPKAAAVIKPVKNKLTKSAMVSHIAESADLSRAQVSAVFSALEGLLLGSVHPNGVGEFMLPGLFKVSLRKVPARKAGTMIRNPATGEMMKAAAKPASVRVKVRALAKLKAAASK